jgi:hypothetical protein
MKTLTQIMQSHLPLLGESPRELIPFVVGYTNLATRLADEQALEFLASASYVGDAKTSTRAPAVAAASPTVNSRRKAPASLPDEDLWYRVSTASFPDCDVDVVNIRSALNSLVEEGGAYLFEKSGRRKEYALRSSHVSQVFGPAVTGIDTLLVYALIAPKAQGIPKGVSMRIGHSVKRGEAIRLGTANKRKYLIARSDFEKYGIDHKKKV